MPAMPKETNDPADEERKQALQMARTYINWISFPKVRTNFKHITFMRPDQKAKTLTFMEGTDSKTTYRVHEDHTLSCEGPLSILDQAFLDYKPAIFKSSWNNLTSKAAIALSQTLDGLDIDPNDHTPSAIHARKLTQDVCASREVHKHINRTARSVVATTQSGYLKNPDKLGFGILYTLIGKERISRTIRIAGSTATFRHHNFIQQNEHECLQAHLENPNATILWFAVNWPIILDPTAPVTKDQILEEAHRAFLYQARQELTDTDDSLEDYWHFFTNLNQRAVNQFPTSLALKNNITLKAYTSGGNPPYSALAAAVMATRKGHNNWTPQYTTAFFREAAQRAKTKKPDLKSLTGQFNETSHYYLTHPYGQTEEEQQTQETVTRIVNNLAAQARSNPDLTWDDWMAEMPDAVRNPPTFRTKKPASKPAATNRPKTLTGKQLLEILGEKELSHIAQKAEKAVCLDIQPRFSITLRVHGYPDSEIRRNPNGTIELPDDNHWRQLQLPDPTKPVFDLKLWFTNGRVQEAIAQAISKATRHLWPNLDTPENTRLPSDNVIHNALLPKVSESLGNRMMDDYTVSCRVHTNLRRTIDTDAWLDASAEAPERPVTASKYNLVLMLKPHMSHLRATNPGALEWLLTYGEPVEPINHPGQAITLAKHSMEQAGLTPANWRRAATLDPATMTAITKDYNPDAAAFILNALTTANTTPPDPGTIDLARTWTTRLAPITSRHRTGNCANDNITRALVLLFRTGLQDNQAPNEEEMADIFDYVLMTGQEGNPINSTTLKGLAKRSEQWHRQLREEPIRHQWEQTLARQNNKYLAWTSLVGPTHLEGFSITPLTTQKDLYEESKALGHCVITYGERCANGKSRIFSIRNNGKNIATSEISPNLSGWTPVQTRGPHNHPVDQRVYEAMQQVAHLYNEADQLTPQVNYWWVDAKTDQPIPEETKSPA